jgi:hypothetical protein
MTEYQMSGLTPMICARDWDDAALCKKLKIGQKAIEDIKSRRRPGSESVGLKMLYELFPQMAV